LLIFERIFCTLDLEPKNVVVISDKIQVFYSQMLCIKWIFYNFRHLRSHFRMVEELFFFLSLWVYDIPFLSFGSSICIPKLITEVYPLGHYFRGENHFF